MGVRIRRGTQTAAASLLLLGGAALATDQPGGTPTGAAATPSPAEAQVSEVKGGFLASLKQAFQEDPEREVVLGHFDVGTPPDTHRFYCLIDPKTGKREPNAVAGQPVHRRDGMTGLKAPAVSPLSCADAQQKGLLITTGYVLKGGAGSPSVGARPAQQPAAAPPAAVGGTVTPAPPPPLPAPQPPPAPAPVPPTPADDPQSEVTAVFRRFIAGQNAHDRAAVAAALLDSREFVWVQSGGRPVWGSAEALAAFAQEWQGTWKLDPQAQELRVAAPAPGVAVLITPLLVTAGDPARYPSTLPVQWEGIFVKTGAGWRITAIFTTPLPSRQGPGGG